MEAKLSRDLTNSPLKIRGVREVMNERAAANPPLRIRGARGVTNN
jgi:hypothetical protein